MLCSHCKENYAVVFVTKIVNGKQSQEGLCLSCARKMGIQPINQLIEQTGMTDEEIDNLNKQVGHFFENIDLEGLQNNLPNNGTNLINPKNSQAGNQLFNLINRAFPKNVEGDDQDQIRESNGDKEGRNTKTKTQEKKTIRKKKYLDIYGANLTDQARDDKLDRIVGREREIERIIQILNRRTKNNPVLLGEPGVGKTAIAEGLAMRIAKRQVPAKLLNTEVYVLDLTSIVAGTQFRGQFESRMKGILEEAKALGNIILVIDELHNIMGAGEAEGAINAANILKPALSKGEVQVIGSTTLNEYRKHIEKDSALERRFQPVIVDEPTIDETIEILRGIKHYYESYHRVQISDEVIKAAVDMSERYITDRFLPDKAIDVIDEASSRANLKNIKLSELEYLKQELKRVQEEKESAISADSIEEYQKAADLKVYECKLIENIKDLELKSKDSVITIEDIAYVVEAWTKVPVQRLTEIEAEKLLNLENRLHMRVIGQEAAVTTLARAIRRNRAGFKKKKKPSSFIFIGPTGVGKTELVRALSVELFDSEEALIRLDMSEYMEKHTVSKLIGSPPGYIGYDEGGQLTEKVRRKPYSVILMDEIEKAHPDVFNMLLQILEDGRLTDSHGRTVNFENTVVIMTSNAGTTLKANGIGFGREQFKTIESRIKEVLKETFRPEFLNRIDEIIVFTELNREELRKIVKIMLVEVGGEAAAKGLKLEVSESAVDFLLEKGYDAKFGARPLRRTIQKHIEDELSEQVLRGIFKENDEVHVDFKDDGLIFSKANVD